MTRHGDEATALRGAVSSFSVSNSEVLVRDLEAASLPLLEWLKHLRGNCLTGTADVLLSGTHAAVLETAGCLSLGLVRPALFSMRAQIDMVLGWLFFKDHKVEWDRVQESGDGFKLKAEVLRYLEDNLPRFRERFGVLEQRSKRRAKQPYAVLSAHVHSQSAPTVPGATAGLASLVRSLPLCQECVEIQRDVSEYLNDLLLACLADSWFSLPTSVVTSAESRLTKDQLRVLLIKK